MHYFILKNDWVGKLFRCIFAWLMKYSNIPSSQSVVYHCKAKGIENIVTSPGSRNAPLIIGFTEDPFFTCFSIVDERCAAFFALGMAQQLRKPVAVVCTSGSALLNYYPAVAEAFYSDISLVVISADRPGHKIDIGDGQTIRQEHIFEKHIGYSANLKQDVVHAMDTIPNKESLHGLREVDLANAQLEIQNFNDTELNQALNIAIKNESPVHINVPLEEPLYGTVDTLSATPITTHLECKNDSELRGLKEFSDIWNASKKKMVLVGVNHPNLVEQQFLDELAEDGSVLVFTETTSNIHHPNFFPSIDSVIAPIEKSEKREQLFKDLKPDILLTFGGLIVSKKIKAFLREFRPQHHWHVDKKKAFDTFFSLSHHFKTDTNTFLNQFLSVTSEVESTYFDYWTTVKEHYQKRRETYLEEIPFSDMSAFHHILSTIPQGYHVQLANSSTVRYSQLFDMDSSLMVFCNRGTSGIDGSTSTAIGASIYSNAPTLLVTGDLSFFYDSNGLWNSYIRPNFRIIVINNEGGGIFRILPGNENTENFKNYFETVQNLEIKELCALFKIEHLVATNKENLKNLLSTFYAQSTAPKLLEIRTPRLLNDKILLTYFDFIS